MHEFTAVLVVLICYSSGCTVTIITKTVYIIYYHTNFTIGFSEKVKGNNFA